MVKHENTNKLFFLSFLLHIIIVAVFIVSFEWSSRNFVLENSDSKTPVINAVFVNDSKIQMPNPKPLPPPKAQEEPKKVTPPKSLPEKVQSPIQKIVKPPVQQKTIALPDPRKKQLQQELIEKQLLADLQQIKKQKKKKHKEKELEKAFEKELKAQKAKSLEQQLLNETNRLSSAQMQKMQGVIDKYKALILQSIGQHWLVPPGVNKALSTELLIRIAPGGTVLDVQLVKSSGDEALDRSARTAVFKASPLPVPTNSEELAPFRQFILKVKPENIISRDEGLN